MDALLIRLPRVGLCQTNPAQHEQLGLLSLATVASQAGFKVEVLDQLHLPYQDLRSRIAGDACGLVGFYCDHDNFGAVCAYSRRLRADFPGLPLLAGGPEATSATSTLLERGAFSAVVRGEGELTFLELLGFFLKGEGRLGDIQGLAYLQDGRSILTRERPPIPGLDVLPVIDRSLQRHRPVKTSALIASGRGCPYHCSFCAEGIAGGYRYRSPESVFREVDQLIQEQEVHYFVFVDDTFIANPDRALRIAEGLARRRDAGYDLAWYCRARADLLVARPELLRAMRQAGLVRIQIGIESGVQEVLDAYGKGITPDLIREAVAAAAQAGIPSITGNFILGGAFESPATLACSLDFARELLDLAPGRLDLSTSLLTPYHGTRVAAQPSSFGLRLLDLDCLGGADDSHPFFDTADLDKWAILSARAAFEQAVQERMQALLRAGAVPRSLVAEHLDLAGRYGLQTRWQALYAGQEALRTYGMLAARSHHGPRASLPPGELDACYPVRTCAFGPFRQGRILLDAHDGAYELGTIDTTLLEACSGKAPLGEILERMRRLFPEEVPAESVRAGVLRVLDELEEKFLVIWRRL